MAAPFSKRYSSPPRIAFSRPLSTTTSLLPSTPTSRDKLTPNPSATFAASATGLLGREGGVTRAALPPMFLSITILVGLGVLYQS